MKSLKTRMPGNKFSAAVARSLLRSARDARKIAKMHGTPIYVMKKGKIVAIEP
jgi:hypothetical protein